jgi:ribosomal protein S18 acetylase RimI-like enzyme
MVIRPAEVADAEGMGRVHVRAWQAAYRGEMPDAYLDGLSEEDRAAGWARTLSRPRERTSTLVAEDDGRIAGFAAAGAAEDDEGVGELYVINVDPEHWGRGAGRALLEEATRQLAALGLTRAVLWVLPANRRARRFYEAAGWTADGVERTAEVLGVTVPETRYSRTLAL